MSTGGLLKLLAFDTSTEACSAALLFGDAITHRFELTERSHAELILPMIDALLTDAGLRVADLDGVAFGRGPGAFTGLRIAAGIAQGYAIGANLPVVPVSSLAAVADQVPVGPGDRVLVCNDARMGETYWSVFRRDSSGQLESVAEERVSAPGSLDPAAIGAVHGAGNAFARYPELRERMVAAGLRIHDGVYPRADAVVRLARVEFAAGRTVRAHEALPVYIRDNVATPGRR